MSGSDDGGGDDFDGDYDDLGDLPDDILPAVEDESDEGGLEEDAAGSDDDESADESETAPDDTEPDFFEKAKPEKQKVDPILRVSNRSTTVIIVPPDERITSNCLTKTEAAYLISMRSQQISKNATCYVDIGTLHDPVAIAFKELLERMCPLKLRRTVGSGPNGELIVEEWDVRTMTYPPLTPPVHLGEAGPAGVAKGRTAKQ